MIIHITEGNKIYKVKYYINKAGDIDSYIYTLNGLPHREKGPAKFKAKGYYQWYQYGKKHRDDGPADIFFGGTKVWYYMGKLHREDGPAIEWDDGNTSWYLKNIEFYNGKWFLKELHKQKKTINIDGKLYLKDGRRIKGL